MPAPDYLNDLDALRGHLDESLAGLSTVEIGDRWLDIAMKLVILDEQSAQFAPFDKNEKKSHDKGIDFFSQRSGSGGRMLFGQAKYSISTKDEIQQILANFERHETAKAPEQIRLFESDGYASRNNYVIVTASPLRRILPRFERSGFTIVDFYKTLVAEQRLIVIDGEAFLKMLSNWYKKTFQVPERLALASTSGWTNEGNVWLGFITGEALRDLYLEHGEALFFENVRGFLGPKSGISRPKYPTVNEEIANTLREEPSSFIERNNGVTFKATNVKDMGSGSIHLAEGSVVNGCQTTVTVAFTKENLREVRIAAKIVETVNAWPIAKGANYQNRIDRIDLDLARFLRPQLLRRVGATIGISLSDQEHGSPVDFFEAIHAMNVRYQEARLLFLGIVSQSPANIDEKNYEKIRSSLFFTTFEDDRRLDKILEGILQACALINKSTLDLQKRYGQEDYARVFKRIVDDQYPQYRIYLGLAAFCTLLGMDISTFERESETEASQVETFVEEMVRVSLENEAGFTLAMHAAFVAFCQSALSAQEDDDKLQRNMNNLLRKPFQGFYRSCRMQLDFFQSRSASG